MWSGGLDQTAFPAACWLHFHWRTDDPKLADILKTRGMKRSSRRGFHSEYLKIFVLRSQPSSFSFFLISLWKAVPPSEPFAVCHNGCGLMPAGYTTWLAVRQDWGLFQIAGNYKYLQNRDRQLCCQLPLSYKNAILRYMHRRELIIEKKVVFFLFCFF